MATLEELNREIRAAREEVSEAIEGAAGHWERQPASGEGEEAWSPRQVAEHVVSVETMYTSRLLQTAGRDGIETLEPAYANPTEAIAGLRETVEQLETRTRDLTQEELARPHERMGDVAGIFAFRARHLREHANQIRAAAALD